MNQLDKVDKKLLNLLQENGRYTVVDLADEIGVSDNTVHNRMKLLEEDGILDGYTARVNYKESGLPLYFHFSCTARISDRSDVAEQIMDIPEVVEVTEVMTGQQNLQIKALGTQDKHITSIAEQLDDLDLEINDENLIRAEHTRLLDYLRVFEYTPEDR